MDKSVIDEQLTYVENLPNDDKLSIMDYTGIDFRELNRRLREGLPLNNTKLIEIKRSLDQSFTNSPSLKYPIVVYRGIRNTLRMPNPLAYTSTTYNIEIAKEFTWNGCCLLRMTIPPGSKILAIERISEASDEEEILLPRGGRFILTSEAIEDGIKFYDIVYIPEGSKEVEGEL